MSPSRGALLGSAEYARKRAEPQVEQGRFAGQIWEVAVTPTKRMDSGMDSALICGQGAGAGVMNGQEDERNGRDMNTARDAVTQLCSDWLVRKQDAEQEELELWLSESMRCGAVVLMVQRSEFRDALMNWGAAVRGWCRAQTGGWGGGVVEQEEKQGRGQKRKTEQGQGQDTSAAALYRLSSISAARQRTGVSHRAEAITGQGEQTDTVQVDVIAGRGASTAVHRGLWLRLRRSSEIWECQEQEEQVTEQEEEVNWVERGRVWLERNGGATKSAETYRDSSVGQRCAERTDRKLGWLQEQEQKQRSRTGTGTGTGTEQNAKKREGRRAPAAQHRNGLRMRLRRAEEVWEHRLKSGIG